MLLKNMWLYLAKPTVAPTIATGLPFTIFEEPEKKPSTVVDEEDPDNKENTYVLFSLVHLVILYFWYIVYLYYIWYFWPYLKE